MAANLKKAGQALRKSFRTRSYTMFQKENVNYIESPAWRTRRASLTTLNSSIDIENGTAPMIPDHIDEESEEFSHQESQNKQDQGRGLRRQASITVQSMREAVGTLRQKLRMSTRRRLPIKEGQGTPTTTATTSRRRHSFGIQKRNKKDVAMSSPFKIDTPKRARTQIKTCLTMETPTRLTREVEALTANMQALSSLTPNTLRTRSATRRQSPPLTNGSLKTPRSTRRSVQTDIY